MIVTDVFYVGSDLLHRIAKTKYVSSDVKVQQNVNNCELCVPSVNKSVLMLKYNRGVDEFQT